MPCQLADLPIYLTHHWNDLSTLMKREILEQEARRNPSSLVTILTKDKNKQRRWICTLSGTIVLEERWSLKESMARRRAYLSIPELKTIDDVHDFFAAYENRKIMTHRDCIALIEGLSPAASQYLMIVVNHVKGRNFSLIDNEHLRHIVGVNRYRKARQELIDRDLIRKCPTLLKRPLELLKIHPTAGYRGLRLEEDYAPVYFWHTAYDVPKQLSDLSIVGRTTAQRSAA